eukprot:1497808-Pyramimonas_sp.AAC.2
MVASVKKVRQEVCMGGAVKKGLVHGACSTYTWVDVTVKASARCSAKQNGKCRGWHCSKKVGGRCCRGPWRRTGGAVKVRQRFVAKVMQMNAEDMSYWAKERRRATCGRYNAHGQAGDSIEKTNHARCPTEHSWQVNSSLMRSRRSAWLSCGLARKAGERPSQLTPQARVNGMRPTEWMVQPREVDGSVMKIGWHSKDEWTISQAAWVVVSVK